MAVLVTVMWVAMAANVAVAPSPLLDDEADWYYNLLTVETQVL